MLLKLHRTSAALAETVSQGVNTEAYLECFGAISELLSSLGMVFSFVTQDIDSKRAILKKYREERDDADAAHLDRMVEYEVEHDCTVLKKGKSASRTLLRLHRAMEFFAAFVDKVMDMDAGGSAANAAQEAYKETLKQHHGWLLQKTVGVALMSLGSRKELFNRVREDDMDDAAIVRTAKEMVTSLQVTYEHVQKLYEKHDLLQLP